MLLIAIAWARSWMNDLTEGDPATSDILLTAIARARSWMNDLSEGRVNSFEEIARSENKVERNIRHLAPLAFVSPRIVEAIANGSAPADIHRHHACPRAPARLGCAGT